jgi:hypothetical protein
VRDNQFSDLSQIGANHIRLLAGRVRNHARTRHKGGGAAGSSMWRATVRPVIKFERSIDAATWSMSDRAC